ncbi:MAG: Nif3-like dinuclear metal center hexameric protein [Phycisphaerae bacterium]|nr:Nif3-like dinuclear metal center hexameric protein [Phycisphaerae bacterium]
MNIQNVELAMNAIAPPSLAADWDNVGLLIGDRTASLKKVLLCIDLTQAVLAEAIAAGAQAVIAYHPPIFKPLAAITAQATPVVHQAIRAGLAVYSPHTALDVVPGGTNDVLADVLGLCETTPLEPSAEVGPALCKVAVFVQPDNVAAVSEAAWSAGGGHIGGYDRCSFQTRGVGTFRGLAGTNPTVGRPGADERTEEIRLEFIAPHDALPAVLSAVRRAHAYEEPAIDVVPMLRSTGILATTKRSEDGLPARSGGGDLTSSSGQANGTHNAGGTPASRCGQGRVGRLASPATVDALVRRIKRRLGVSRVAVARAGAAGKIERAAVGAGSCGSLFRAALAAGATFFLTGEMRHHDALAATQQGMTCVCVGHSNSERIVLPALRDRLLHALPKLDVILSQADRDPMDIV